MWIDEMDNRDKIWRFRLIDNVTVIGSVEKYKLDALGHPIMLGVWATASSGITSIPWTAIVHISPLV